MSNEQSCFTFTTDSLGCVPDISAGRPVVVSSLPLSPIAPDSADDSVMVTMGSSRDESEVGVMVPPQGDVSSGLTAVSPLPSVEGLMQDLLWAPVAPRSPRRRRGQVINKPIVTLRALQTRSLGGGWLGKVRSWQSGHRTPSVHSVLDVHFGILPIGHRTTLCHRGSSGFPCITCGSSSGLRFHSRPAFSRWEQDGGWTLFVGSGYGGGRRVAAVRLSDANKFRRFGPVYALAAGDGIKINREEPRSQLFSGGGGGGGCPRPSGPPRFRSDGGDGAVAVLTGSRYGYIRLAASGLAELRWTYFHHIGLGLPHCMGFHL